MKQELIHASAVAINGHGILLTGESGSGKSDLALRLMDRGAVLISDDQVGLLKQDGTVMLNRIDAIAGKLEVFGIGIVDCDSVNQAPLILNVKLTSQAERYPMDSQRGTIAGISIPFVRVYSPSASAPIKVEIALKNILQDNKV